MTHDVNKLKEVRTFLRYQEYLAVGAAKESYVIAGDCVTEQIHKQEGRQHDVSTYVPGRVDKTEVSQSDIVSNYWNEEEVLK